MNTWFFEQGLIKFLLVLFRCMGFLMLTPVFGRREFPVQARIGLAALLSFIIYPLATEISYTGGLWDLAILAVKETTVGVAVGYITLLMFSALYVAGEIIDMQMGFGIVNVIDPQSSNQVPLMGNFYYIVTILVFLTVNGHHVLISAIIKSFEIVPLGKAIFTGNLFSAIRSSFVDMFSIGVKVSFPVVSMIFLTDLALGIIARTVPQMNVFIVGLPLKIFVGIVGMIFVFPMFIVALDVIFNGAYDNILLILRGMLKGP
ncbi:flagellar biosynthetic protein FliR [Thermoanaerobacterium sp. DL9XJH110]|uniref:flagellar biosynthetic protein FliR n=1 Tax=Thermoanaerobacterium sp. DL9XJH110 TaxID=3386643 RepID=UPI003BB5B84F